MTQGSSDDDQNNGRDLLRLMRDAPDWMQVSDDETCQILGISRDTLFRMDRAGKGPPITRIAPRRKTRSIGGIRKLIAALTST